MLHALGVRVNLASVLILAAVGAAGCTFTTLRGAAIEHATQHDDRPVAPMEPSRWTALPGERIESELELVGMSAGRFIIEAREPCRLGDRRLLPLVSRSESTGLLGVLARYGSEATTWIDAESGEPLFKRSEVRRGDEQKHYVTDFRGDGYHTTYTRGSGDALRTTAKRWKLPPDAAVHDLVSIVASLRRWRAERGTRTRSHVIMGTRVWRADFVFMGLRRGIEPGDERRAIHVEGIAYKLSRDLGPTDRAPRSLSLWFSDDERRIPLKLVAQDDSFSIRLELEDYRPGKASRPDATPKPCASIPAEPAMKEIH